MTKEQIHNDVQDIFRDIFDDGELTITDDTTAEDIEEWDSLAQVRITVSIEKKFGIKFGFDELTALQNVGEMLKLVEKKLKK